MGNPTKPANVPPQVGNIKIPTLAPVPYVVVKLPDGRTVLRHPDEIKKKG